MATIAPGMKEDVSRKPEMANGCVRPCNGRFLGMALRVQGLGVCRLTLRTGEDSQMSGLVKKIAGMEEGGPVEYEGAIPDGETWQEGVGGKGLLQHREADLAKEVDDEVDKQWLCHATADERDVWKRRIRWFMASYVV
jgi:hypothetical protein